VSDQPDEQDGTAEEVTEPAAEQSLTAWPESAEGPAWSGIEDQAESAAPGPAGPGASQEATTAVEPVTDAEPAADVAPATEAGRSRRPTSLREQYVQSNQSVPRRTLSSPAFPSAPGIPGSAVPSPASEFEEPGNPGQTSEPAPAAHVRDHQPGPSLKERLDKLPLDKLPLDKLSLSKLPLDKLSRPNLPTDKLPTDKLPVEQLRTLTRQRPEVGLGLAFAGGLVIATILKRLGRR
jgi:hypothetical protein